MNLRLTIKAWYNQDAVVLVKEQTNRSMQQNGEPINITNFSLTRSKISTMEQRYF